MHWTINYLLFITLVLVVEAKQLNLQRVCERDGSDGDQLLLDYDELTARLSLRVGDKNNASFTSFKIHLLANWNQFEADEEACQDAHFLPHSDYDITFEKFPLTINYVYGGFYRLTVIPWIDNTFSFKAMSTTFVALSLRKPIAIHNWTTHFIIHPLPRFSSIIVQFLPAPSEYEFNSYEVLLSDCDPALLSLSSGHTSICQANESKPECTFEHLTVGKYCAFVRPLDDRCNYGNVWQVKDHCIVHSDVIELVHPSHSRNVEWLPRGTVLSVENHSATILAAVMVTFIFGAAIFVGTLIYRVTRGRSTTIHKTFKFWAIPSTQPGPICPILPKSILLLWFRDNTQIVQQVDHLKIQLMDHCNAKLVDVYDDAFYNELSIDPIQWLNKTMSTQDLRVLVVGSPRLEQLLVDTEQTDTEMDTLEGLTLYAIKELWLHKSASRSLYSTIFFVGFDNVPFGGRSSELTPFRCFVLPMHCTELFIYLNNG